MINPFVSFSNRLPLRIQKAKLKIVNENEAAALELIKVSLREILSCEKTLTKLKKTHNELLDTNIEDLELDGFIY